jgi:phosphoserine phosphatase
MQIEPEQVLAVGDGENDICMLRDAGMSVAFQPKNARVRQAAQQVLWDSLEGILVHALSTEKQ